MTAAERHQLIDALLDGDIMEADFLRLEAELTVDPAARREYYERVTLSLLLETAAAASTSHGEQRSSPSFHAATTGRQWRWAFTAMATVAAVLLAIVAWQWDDQTKTQVALDQQQQQVSSGLDNTETLASGFAVVSGQADAVWGDGQSLSDGSLVPPGELHLQGGVVQFELFSGVTLVVEGDSRFSILSPMEVDVTRGKLRARVPEPAQGFRILTDAGEVVDLGTEFAVNVTDDGSEVHVLDGEVEWHPQDSPSRRMQQGQAARLTDEGQIQMAARSEEFVGPLEMQTRLHARQSSRLDRWRGQCQNLQQDPRLVAYYQVTPGDLSNRRLPNLAKGSGTLAGEGAVVAATPASNRWGQAESALDFSPAGSRVRLSIPGEIHSLTLVCWVKINSLDRWYNSLFLTDGHEEGEPHWQIMDDGRLFFSVKKRDQFDRSQGESDKHVYFSPSFWRSELSGQWLMIATVYDVESRLVSHYLNGDVLSQETIPEEYLVENVRIGNASIGNWGLPKRNEPRFAVRNLNGSIDEFALFSAALSAEEIRELYDDGKP